MVAEDQASPPMLAFSKLRKAFKIPRRNHNALRRSFLVSEERVSQLGLRFCIWVALKFEDLHTDESCDLVSQILYTNNWFSLYWEALELLKKSGVLITSESVRALIRSYSLMGLTEKALETFSRMHELDCKPDTHTFNTILKALLRKELFLLAFAVYSMVLKSNSCPDQYTYNMLIDGFCKSGDIEGALETLTDMEQSDTLPDIITFTTIICGLCQMNKVDEANRLFNVMKERGCHPDLISYNVLINGFCKQGRLDEAVSFLQLIERDGYVLQLFHFKLFKDLQLKGLSPDSVTYGTLIDGLYRADREEDAFKIHEHMLKHGCKPSFAVYRALMTWLCRKRKVSMAFSLYMECLKNVAGRDSDSINALKEHFVRGEVEQTIRGLLELDFSPTSCVHLINGLCVKGKLDNAVDIFLYSLDKGFMLGPRICKQLLEHLLDSQDKKDYAIDLIGKKVFSTLERNCARAISSIPVWRSRLFMSGLTDHVGDVPLSKKILAALTTGKWQITDLVKVGLQAEGKLPPGVPRRYSGSLNAFSTIVKQEGIGVLWTELGPDIARNAIINASELASYDQVKEEI
ncbi:Tetratricopeptide-like helical domain superfamily [Sesbania bispinosa]|nr:Tetratricopeptide-like helical domain superfamily [Sesbania bispinosa]